MLKIHYGIREKTVCNIRPYCIESPVFGQISPFMLSGGVKALLLMQNTDRVINASKCGDNCAKWIKKIAEQKDLEIDLEHIMRFNQFPDNEFKAYLINTNTMLNSFTDYLSAMVDF